MISAKTLISLLLYIFIKPSSCLQSCNPVNGTEGSVHFTRILFDQQRILQQRTSNDSNRNSETKASSTSPDCETYGKCGPFGSCNSKDSPICSCLRGFQPKDAVGWQAGNWTSGCLRQLPLQCDKNNGGKQDGFLKLQQMKVPDYQDRRPGPENECEGLCLNNCSCIAYAHDPGVGCLFWSGSLINIQKTPSSGSDLYIRLAYPDLVHRRDLKKTIIIVVITGSITMLIFTIFYWKRMAKKRGKRMKRKQGKENPSTSTWEDNVEGKINFEELPLFRFEVIAKATNHFNVGNTLGKGGYGPVYKGRLENGKEIAVKRLGITSGQGIQEFKTEVAVISRLQHRNLVRLLGCCVENGEQILIYEFMPNKSLDKFLFDPSQEILDWRKRFKIIEGTVRGLLYLHRDSRMRIIHRDLKAGNILLDNDWNPKIADFGMARNFGGHKDHISTRRIAGTKGYMAPEYAFQGRFSEKSDVFSLGVLMLEIVSGRTVRGFYNDDNYLNLIEYAWDLWSEGRIETMIDPRISTTGDEVEIMRCIHIGLLCVEELPRDRPRTSAILSMLSSEIMKPPAPKKPAFVQKWSFSDPGTGSSSQQSGSSLNDITLTTIVGR